MTLETRPSTSASSKPWSVEQRLEFIEFMAYWEGSLRRADIMTRFGVSPQQASGDLTSYQELAPENLRYDLKLKRYVTTDQFTCHLITPDADRYLGQLTVAAAQRPSDESAWLVHEFAAAVIPMPIRHVSSGILREMLAAVRAKKSIDIHYQSLNPSSPSLIWRRITPHAFASDGFRWHVRAFCHRDHKFKDFVLSRCVGTRDQAEAGADASADHDWADSFIAVFVANPLLTSDQRQAIEEDYAMENGKVQLAIRYALLYYFHKRLGADFAPSLLRDPTGVPRETPIIIENLEQYRDALERVQVHVRASRQASAP
jgi:hypothetical protein